MGRDANIAQSGILSDITTLVESNMPQAVLHHEFDLIGVYSLHCSSEHDYKYLVSGPELVVSIQ